MKKAIETTDKIDDQYRELSEEGRIEFITFHPSYSYEEFIEGITVELNEGVSCEQPRYVLKSGKFKTLCKNALAAALGKRIEDVKEKSWKEVFDEYKDKRKQVDFSNAPRFVLIIDEINRGDIAKVFGELITLVEADKRIGKSNELIVRLPTSDDEFGVPPNLYIIGTMNTADRSIALLDIALRRRFGFIEMNPDFDVLKTEHLEKNKEKLESGVYELLVKSVEAIKKINQKLCGDKTIGRDRQIGQSFLFKVFKEGDLLLVWRHEILPLLEEYCYNDYKKINRILFNQDTDTEWISEAEGIKTILNLTKMLDAIIK